MSGYSGKAVASHTPIVKVGLVRFAVSVAQYRLLGRAILLGGPMPVKGVEVRTARALSLFGELREDGPITTFTIKDGVTLG